VDALEPSWNSAFLRILRSTHRHGGRAARTDLVIYSATIMIGFLIVSFVAGLFLEFDASALLKDALSLLALVPVPALLARRLHDSGKVAVWVWLGLPAIGLWLARSAISVQLGTERSIQFDRMTWPLDWLAILANIALLILLALPGTIGPNRFGEDPRGRAATVAD
jgi:uncharacterized membrane protein YhaH (DUF805 family)